MSVLAALLLPTLSLVWPFSPVVLLSSLLACGSSPLVIPLVQLASYLGYFSFLHNRLTVLEYSAFTSYGAFWLSFATLLIPGSGVAAAYAASTDPAQEVDAIAIYLITWMVVTFLFLFVSFFILYSTVETRLICFPLQHWLPSQVHWPDRALLLSDDNFPAPRCR
jgi:hypothetical protein